MYIKVKVMPSSKKECVERASSDIFLVSVKEPAKRNLANKRMVEIISEEFGVPSVKVRIVSGHHSRSKILTVDND